ncbi:Erythrocyte membrane-associated antigen, partial [Cryptosporidium felis]
MEEYLKSGGQLPSPYVYPRYSANGQSVPDVKGGHYYSTQNADAPGRPDFAFLDATAGRGTRSGPLACNPESTLSAPNNNAKLYLPQAAPVFRDYGSGKNEVSLERQPDPKPAPKLDSQLSPKTAAEKTSSSNWKEWNSYSKLLPLAVAELDVQSECNFLSNLFCSFSNTVKGFVSNFEFEKLMEQVNIIEVGYRGTIFGVMDRNQDNYITEVEFLTGMLIFRPYSNKEKAVP